MARIIKIEGNTATVKHDDDFLNIATSGEAIQISMRKYVFVRDDHIVYVNVPVSHLIKFILHFGRSYYIHIINMTNDTIARARQDAFKEMQIKQMGDKYT